MKILVVGLSVRLVVESAVPSGYGVIGLDAFGDQDLRILAQSCSLHHDFHARYSPMALYEASRQLAFDAVAYTSSLENHPEILGRIAAGRRIVGNVPQVIASVRDWPRLIARLKQGGFRVPQTIFAGQTLEIDTGRRWLVRPLLSGGGHGIAFLQQDRIPREGWMLQEYIHGKPCSASFVANGNDCVLIGITEQLIGVDQFGARGFRYCGNILPLPEAIDPRTGGTVLERLRELAAFLTREYRLTGANGIDFILKDGEIFLTEVNPRYSASMELIERAYGLPVFQTHVQAVLDGRLPEFDLETKLEKRNFIAKGVLFTERDAVAPDTRSWMLEGIRDVPQPGERLRKGGPICTILTSRPTYDEAFADLISQAARLKEEMHA